MQRKHEDWFDEANDAETKEILQEKQKDLIKSRMQKRRLNGNIVTCTIDGKIIKLNEYRLQQIQMIQNFCATFDACGPLTFPMNSLYGNILICDFDVILKKWYKHFDELQWMKSFSLTS